MEKKTTDSRVVSKERASVLKGRIQDYLDEKDNIITGLHVEEKIRANQEKIKKHLSATEEQWNDWHWQIRNRFKSAKELRNILDLTERELQSIEKVGQEFRWAVSPYYLSLITEHNYLNDPVYLQSIPLELEIDCEEGEDDPMGEELTNPAECVTRRYPDRLIINVTNQCAMYCRHCQRRRNIGEVDTARSKKDLQEALDYIKENKEIRDVLITGGDPLTLSDNKLDWLLTELDKIEHVEMKRLGTRMLVTLPQRITPELCEMLKKHQPIYVNTHFNSPLEITKESKRACEMLSNNGFPLGNQAVLLKGINDNPHIMKKLNQELLKIRVRPYYIFHAKAVKGTAHFRTAVSAGIEIMENLRGYTSGLGIPTFIVNAPKGKGKTPMLPQYLISQTRESILIRTWEGEVVEYFDKELISEEEKSH